MLVEYSGALCRLRSEGDSSPGQEPSFQVVYSGCPLWLVPQCSNHIDAPRKSRAQIWYSQITLLPCRTPMMECLRLSTLLLASLFVSQTLAQPADSAALELPACGNVLGGPCCTCQTGKIERCDTYAPSATWCLQDQGLFCEEVCRLAPIWPRNSTRTLGERTVLLP